MDVSTIIPEYVTTDLKSLLSRKSSCYVGYLKCSVSGGPYYIADIYLQCKFCENIVVYNSIIGSTEDFYVVEEVINVDFENDLDDFGVAEITCRNCCLFIGYCNRNRKEKNLFKQAVNLVFEIKKSFFMLNIAIT
ncbi:hypothetical protein TNIN_173321 [Trichonephila inaurata madagascariensis]|uniref:Uncharacterized protein n=1 Tax=Trichonephila inaurata madagascariensis TaxID=2747483 RepID=A0A8X6X3C7_9ARAC|nr:hypothetical protein TNIN_367951 [Trichonephila inaurata madagascariensis]GFY78552.1 hypothetical protein TNIN_173321 [Trichonephila inaurata madagascariensis]